MLSVTIIYLPVSLYSYLNVCTTIFMQLCNGQDIDKSNNGTFNNVQKMKKAV